MRPDEIRALLEGVADGTVSTAEAMARLKDGPLRRTSCPLPPWTTTGTFGKDSPRSSTEREKPRRRPWRSPSGSLPRGFRSSSPA